MQAHARPPEANPVEPEADPVEPEADPVEPEADPVEPEAVFIVGVSRSGTTLLERILDSHSQLAIARENHYLRHLLRREGARYYFRRAGDLQDDANVRRLVWLIWSGEFQRRSRLREVSPYWRWLTRTVRQEDFEDRLLRSGRSERDVFSVMMRTYADVTGKRVIGEKTPAHLASVDTLFDWYPDARVIHMLRDPRAVYVSEVRRRSANASSVPYRYLVRAPGLLRAFVLLQVAVVWADAIRRHRRLAAHYPDGYRLIRFEDLVCEPHATLQRLLGFVGLAWEEGLLAQKVVSKGSRRGEVGFDAGAADRWRDEIGPLAKRSLELLLSHWMRALGYGR